MQDLITDPAVKALLEEEEAKRKEQEAWLKEQLVNRLDDGRAAAIDWTPLAAQLDAMAGGDVAAKAAASNYARSLKDEKRDQELLDKIASFNKASSVLSPKDILMTQFKREGIGQTQAKSQEFNEEQKNIDRQIAEDQKAASWVEKEINDPLKQSRNDIAMAESAIDSNDIAALNQSLPSIARGIIGQKGVLSDTDIALTIPKSYASSLAEFLKKINGEAEIPESLKNNVRNLIARARKNIADNARAALKAKQEEAKRTTMARSLGYVTPVYKVAEEGDVVRYFTDYKAPTQTGTSKEQPAQVSAQSLRERLNKLKSGGK